MTVCRLPRLLLLPPPCRQYLQRHSRTLPSVSLQPVNKIYTWVKVKSFQNPELSKLLS